MASRSRKRSDSTTSSTEKIRKKSGGGGSTHGSTSTMVAQTTSQQQAGGNTANTPQTYREKDFVYILCEEENRWHLGSIVKCLVETDRYFVKFRGWQDAWNQWVSSSHLNPVSEEERLALKNKKSQPSVEIARKEESDVSIRKRFLSNISAGNRQEVIAVFRLKGASWVNKQVKDKDGWTAAHYATRNLKVDMLEVLFEYGACLTGRSIQESNDVNAGSTALHMACRIKGGSEDAKSACVKFLCGFGHAFVLAQDALGKSALDLVRRQRKPMIRDILQAALADPNSHVLHCDHNPMFAQAGRLAGGSSSSDTAVASSFDALVSSLNKVAETTSEITGSVSSTSSPMDKKTTASYSTDNGEGSSSSSSSSSSRSRSRSRSSTSTSRSQNSKNKNDTGSGSASGKKKSSMKPFTVIRQFSMFLPQFHPRFIKTDDSSSSEKSGSKNKNRKRKQPSPPSSSAALSFRQTIQQMPLKTRPVKFCNPMMFDE